MHTLVNRNHGSPYAQAIFNTPRPSSQVSHMGEYSVFDVKGIKQGTSVMRAVGMVMSFFRAAISGRSSGTAMVSRRSSL